MRSAPDPSRFVPAGCGGGDDPIFALNAEAVRRARAGEDVVNATVGALLADDGSLLVLPSVIETIGATDPVRAAGYAPIAGAPDFTSAVARDLAGGTELLRHALAVATPGGSGALHLAIATFLERGQAAIAPDFFWGPYETMARHAGRALATFRTFDRDGRLDLAAYEEALARCAGEQGRVLVLLNFPCNNPTGYSLDDSEWRAVMEISGAIARRAPVAVAIDFAYARYGEGDPNAWLSHAPPLIESGLLLTAWSASKTFLQYGARVGALVAIHPDEGVRRRIHDALSFGCRGTWSNCNHRGQAAIARILDDPELADRVDREREEARRTLSQRVQAFKERARSTSLRFPRYEGGFFVAVFCDDGEETARRLRERGVFVVPMNGAVRVGLCSVPEAKIGRLVEELHRAIAGARG